MHDLVVSDALPAGGSGGEPHPVDVAVDDGIITAVTEPYDESSDGQEIDAAGRLVAPVVMTLGGRCG